MLPVQIPKVAIPLLLRALLAAAILLVARPVHAQDEPAVSEKLAEGEVTITCPWFGVGGVVRNGDWAGLRLGINDSAAKPREIIVRITIPDADGDRVLYERVTTTNPGVPQPLWAYIRVPSRFGQSDTLSVTAWEALEQGNGAPGEQRGTFVAGKQLALDRLVRPNVMRRIHGLIGIAGSRSMGLRAYEGLSESDWLPAGHERSYIVSRLDADTLPDRWFGLAPFDVIVWNEPTPSSLGSERAQAVREWVQRGGHLVVVLPRVGQTWTDENNNPLYDITPRVAVHRREGIDLTPYGALISHLTTTAYPAEDSREVLQSFTPVPGAEPYEAISILTGVKQADGSPEVLAVRRIVGTGMVTLVGLDVASGWMERHNLPEPELFWNRILGRRGDTLGPKSSDPMAPVMFRARDPVTLDGAIPGMISKTGQAAAGVLLGFVVFVAYWLIAGPAGYAILKKTGMARHGWLAFVLAAALFTGVAWGGATLIRPSQIEAKHLTIIDHVYGQSIERSRTWMSLLVPEYGQATIIVGDPSSNERTRFHNLVAPWEPAEFSGEGFPDARGYRIDCKNPDQATIPTRATVKQLQADWAGASTWKMPRPTGDSPEDAQIRFADESAPSILKGTLVHELPAALTDVVIIVNMGQKDITRSFVGTPGLTSKLATFILSNPWGPGKPLDMAFVTPRSTVRGEKQLSPEDYLSGLLKDPIDSQERPPDAGTITTRLTALAFFSQLQPPDPPGDRMGRSEHVAQRKYSHGMDLGRWFTEPCMIIVGHLGAETDVQSPTPLYISTGGQPRPLHTAGRTVVRWVYPLGARPPTLPPLSASPAEDSAKPAPDSPQ